MVAMPSSSKERQARHGAQGQPWFYPRLVAYGYFWLSERAYRVMGDSVPKHTGPISLTGSATTSLATLHPCVREPGE